MNKRGFTLIEILVVIAIMGFLISAGLGSYTSSQRRGRDNRRKNDLQNIAKALEYYYNDKTTYPLANASGQMMGCGVGATVACDWGSSSFSNTTTNTVYMVTLPNDPATNRRYYYRRSGTGYQLYAALENDFDSDFHAGGYGPSCNNGGSAIPCTYGISSSNVAP